MGQTGGVVKGEGWGDVDPIALLIGHQPLPGRRNLRWIGGIDREETTPEIDLRCPRIIEVTKFTLLKERTGRARVGSVDLVKDVIVAVEDRRGGVIKHGVSHLVEFF